MDRTIKIPSQICRIILKQKGTIGSVTDLHKRQVKLNAKELKETNLVIQRTTLTQRPLSFFYITGIQLLHNLISFRRMITQWIILYDMGFGRWYHFTFCFQLLSWADAIHNLPKFMTDSTSPPLNYPLLALHNVLQPSKIFKHQRQQLQQIKTLI